MVHFFFSFIALIRAEDDTAAENDKALDREFHCKVRTCPKGQHLMRNPSFQNRAKGCPAMANDIMGGLMGGGGGGPMPSEACIAREICYQTCGKQSVECDRVWNKVQKKHCGSNQMCRLQLMLAANIRVPEQNLEECDIYEQFQKEACVCVDDAKKDDHIIEAVEALYSRAPKVKKEKLDANGKLSESGRKAILDKWSDNHRELFYVLPMKYWKNVKIIKRIEKADPSKAFKSPLGAKDKKEDSDSDSDKKEEL